MAQVYNGTTVTGLPRPFPPAPPPASPILPDVRGRPDPRSDRESQLPTSPSEELYNTQILGSAYLSPSSPPPPDSPPSALSSLLVKQSGGWADGWEIAEQERNFDGFGVPSFREAFVLQQKQGFSAKNDVTSIGFLYMFEMRQKLTTLFSLLFLVHPIYYPRTTPSLPPSSNSDHPGSHSGPFSPLPTTVLLPSFFFVYLGRIIQHFLPSSARVELQRADQVERVLRHPPEVIKKNTRNSILV